MNCRGRLRRFISAAALLLTAALLTGCNQAVSAADCIMRFQDAMNRQEFREAFNYVADYDNFGFTSAGSDQIIGTVAQTLSIEVLGESGIETSKQVNVAITSIDLREAYCDAAREVIPTYYQQAVSGQPISDAELGTKLVNEVVRITQSGSAKGITTNCTLNVVQNKRGKWEIVLDTASYSAITGYIDEANNLITTGAIATEIYGVYVEGLVSSSSDVSAADVQ